MVKVFTRKITYVRGRDLNAWARRGTRTRRVFNTKNNITFTRYVCYNFMRIIQDGSLS